MNHAVASTLASLTLIVSGCTSGGPGTTPSPSGGTKEALISSLPVRCGSLGRAPAATEVTFLAEGRLYSTLPDGSGTKCIARLGDGEGLAWGGEADRVAISTSRGGIVISKGARELLDPGDLDPSFQGLSRPTGTSLVYISADGRRLYKLPVEGGEPEDISFLARHDEVAYHPSGTSVIAVGENRDGEYGIFFATNEGASSQLLAVAEDARRVYSLAFAHNGRTLYYAAEHEDRYDLHALALPSGDRAGSTEAVEEGRLRTLHQSQRSIDDVAVSEFAADPLVAFAEGDCTTGAEAFAWDGEGVQPVDAGAPGGVTRPVGWLPDGSLLVTTRRGGCDQPATLKVWRGGAADLLLADVTQAAVRAVLPPPPRPLIPAEGVVP